MIGVVTGGSRTVRGKFMALKREEYIRAARLDNVGDGKLIFSYLLRRPSGPGGSGRSPLEPQRPL